MHATIEGNDIPQMGTQPKNCARINKNNLNRDRKKKTSKNDAGVNFNQRQINARLDNNLNNAQHCAVRYVASKRQESLECETLACVLSVKYAANETPDG